MEEFNLQLGGQLDQSHSKEQVNKDLVTLANAIEHLKLQAEIDPNSVKNIAQQLSKIMNQKVVVDNIQVDSNKINKTGEQIGKNLGDNVLKNLTSSLNSVKQNIDSVIKGFSNQKLNSYDLSKMFNLNRANIDGSVIQQVRNLTKELNTLAKEALKTNSDSSWEGIVNKISSLSQVLTKFGSTRDLTQFKESLDVLDYFQNKKIFVGNKSEALANAGLNVKELNNQFRNLGVTFTTVSEGSTKLDTIWSELFNISPNLQNFIVFGDQLNAIVEHLKIAKEAMYGDSNLQPINSHDVNSVLLDWLSNLKNASKKLNVFKSEQTELEQRITQASTSATNTVIQNEKKKQDAIQQTANVQRQIAESESLIKSGANVTTFEYSNNAAREASEYFKQLLQDENAVISVSERFGQLNGLTSFTVNVKRATGEVESLRYALEEMKDANGNGTSEFYFTNKGAELNNSNAIKQIQAVENAFADYTAKLAQFKSTNSEILSGLETPISVFENKLAGLRSGAVTIDEVKNSFKSLNTEASNITANFSRQLSPIDSAIRSLAKGEETIAGLRAEFKGLNNTPKEINSELNKCSSLLEKVKKIESENGRTSEWSQAYKEWANYVDALRAKLSTLKKEQTNVASTQIFNISDLKNNDIAYMSKVYNTIEKQMSEINKMANAKGWNIVDVSGVEQADGKIKQLTLTVQDAEGALKHLTMQREKLQGNGKAQFGLMQVGDVKVIETAAQAQEKLSQSTEKANAKLEAQVNEIQLSMEGKNKKSQNYDYQIDTEIKKLKDLGFTDEEVAQKVKVLTDAQTELKRVMDSSDFDSIAAKNQAIVESDKERTIALNQVRTAYGQLKNDASQYYNLNKQAKLSTDIQNWLSKNSRASKEAKKSLNAYYRELSNGRVSVDRLNYIEKELKDIDAVQRGLGKLGKNLKDQFKEAGASFTQWLSVSSGIMALVYQLQKIPKEVIKVNAAMIELTKVSDASASEIKKYFDEAAKSAKDLGSSVSDVINATADFSRLGYSLPEASELAKVATLYKNVGDGIDINEASSSLVSTMKAFNITAKDSISIIDKLNEVGNNFSISSGEIGEALKRSASSLSVAGNTLSESIGLITAGKQNCLKNMETYFYRTYLIAREA